jgi:hypothetical protein
VQAEAADVMSYSIVIHYSVSKAKDISESLT